MAHLLEMKNICKSFSGVSVLKNNHLELEAGEVHALLGENGAGKSTLIKILGGVYTKDSGQILVDGQEVEITGVESAKEHGIRIIHQELMLIPDMTISENIFIGQEPKTKAGTVDKKKMNEMAQGFLDSMHLDLKSTQFIRDLNIAQQQMVEIIRAISFGAKIIVMDEPTSSLTENEVDALFEAIKALKAKNVGIIYISHRMAELDAITDRITVMRDGEYIDTVVTKETTHDDLVALMVGRKLGDLYQKHENYSDDIILKVEKLASGKEVKNVDFELRRGEVLGFSGLVGSGRSETMECIFGLRHKDSGHIYIENKEVDIKNVKTAINAGIGLVPEDRKQSGIYPIQGIRFNATIEILDKFLKKGRYNRKKEIELARKYVDEVMQTKYSSIEQEIGKLSGGNQQKAIIAREIDKNPELLIAVQPTRGLDVGAIEYIHKQLVAQRDAGKGVLLVSLELDEVMNVSDRILVMYEGEIVGEFDPKEVTVEELGLYMAGSKRKGAGTNE